MIKGGTVGRYKIHGQEIDIVTFQRGQGRDAFNLVESSLAWCVSRVYSPKAVKFFEWLHSPDKIERRAEEGQEIYFAENRGKKLWTMGLEDDGERGLRLDRFHGISPWNDRMGVLGSFGLLLYTVSPK